ncbi:MAG TPA: alkaline phosphatase family protein [Candidatus Acidoferrales bacterium]|nr:alkaline phosphatase family protein [Candidatus Acidoferrales bacterium]
MILKCLRVVTSVLMAAAITATGPGSAWAQPAPQGSEDGVYTTTPIKHVIVIFQENISFDHYFGTYPYAANSSNEPQFYAQPNTPQPNNLLSGGLLDQNPNSVQPFRLDRTQALTCDQNHDYTPEQMAVDHGLMDKFPQSTGVGSTSGSPCNDYGHGPGLVMGYYDGNTVTAMWNFAQYYAVSDNFAGTMFGPSTVGALNLVTGTTTNATLKNGSASGTIANAASSGAVIGDPDPGYDDCSGATKTHVTMTGKNVGDLLNVKGVTWGWFQGGFAPTAVSATGIATCGSTSTSTIVPALGNVTDYVPHHEPFQYFQDTANPHHLAPLSVNAIGQTDRANHQYDLSLFYTALAENKLPSVTYLKAKAIQNGHPGNSDPLDEQAWLVNVVNAVEKSPYWADTAIFVTYDDSDGWYDHAMDAIVNQSNASDDALAGPGNCGTTPANDVPGRCGYGPRLPLVVISPYAKQNYFDHQQTDQSSVLRFIEDNWNLGRIGGDSNDEKAGVLTNLFDFSRNDGRAAKISLDPATGLVITVQQNN